MYSFSNVFVNTYLYTILRANFCHVLRTDARKDLVKPLVKTYVKIFEKVLVKRVAPEPAGEGFSQTS